MNSTRRWLEGQLRRAERANLDAALLTQRGAHYAATRLGWMGARSLLRTGLHTVEYLVLTQQIPFRFLAPLFVMRSLPALFTGLHWGALETLRAEVRHETQRRHPERARQHVETWLAWTGIACAALLAAITTFIWVQPYPEEGPLGLYGAFAIVCAFATGADLWTRTYHAGVFALGRVYRPVWTFFAVELLEIGVLVQSSPRLGPFALHAAILLGSATRGLMTLYYARRAYHARRLPRPHWFRPRALLRVRLSELRTSLKHVVATLPSQLDRMLLIALLHAPTLTPDALPLSAPYYALRPLASFAQGWARGFYPDLVRLDVSAIGVLRARFERLLARVAWTAGLLSAAALAAASYALFGGEGLTVALWLAPLSVVRSQLALEQVRGFAYGAVPGLMRMGGVLLIGLWLASYVHVTDRLMLGAVVLLLVGARLAAGKLVSRAATRLLEKAQRLPLSAWLSDLSAQTGPVRLTVALVDTRVASTGALTRVLAASFPERRLARLGGSWLLWWEPGQGAEKRIELVRACAGALQALECIAGNCGARVLAEARERELLPKELGEALAQPKPAEVHAALLREAQRLVPEAHSIDLTGASPALARLSGRELALVRRALAAAAREQTSLSRRAPWQVAVYAPAGELELVFLWPRGAAQGGELVRLLRRASWRDSLRP